MLLVNLLSGVPDNRKSLSVRLVEDIEASAKGRFTQGQMLASARLGLTAFNSWKNGLTSPTIEKLESLCVVVGRSLTARIDLPVHQKKTKTGGESLQSETRNVVTIMERLPQHLRHDILEHARAHSALWSSANPQLRGDETSASGVPHNK